MQNQGLWTLGEGPCFCRFSCPSPESLFNYPPQCARSEVSAECPGLLLSRALRCLLLSQGFAWLSSKNSVITSGPLESPGGLFGTNIV